MRGIAAGVVVGWVVAGWAVASWGQSDLTLVAEADASIREHQPTATNPTSILEVRSRAVEGSGRQNVAYIRFDLSVLADAPETGAVFSVTRQLSGSAGTTFTNGDVQVYGLLDVFENTSQGWGTGLSYGTTGLELPGDGDSMTQDLELSRLQFIGDLPDSVSTNAAETLFLAGADLDAFLADRFANGGAATLLLVQRDSIDKELYFTNLESTSGNPVPTLDLVGVLGGVGDLYPPTVSRVVPADAEIDILPSADVQVTFSEQMDPATITSDTFTLVEDGSGGNVPATVSYDAATVTATLSPTDLLVSQTGYTAQMEGGVSGATDAAGNPLAADFTWTFTTLGDMIPPTVSQVAPTNGTIDVELAADVLVTFSEEMDPATITSDTFTLTEDGSGAILPATVTYDVGTATATLNPVDPLVSLTGYTARVVGGTGGVTDLGSNPLAADFTWTFTTVFVAPPGPNDPIHLIPDADARLANDSNRGPTSSVGGSGLWEVRWHEAPRVRIGYLRYDISDVDPERFPTATIRGTFTGSGFNGPGDGSGMWNVYGLNDDVVSNETGRLGNDWPEGDVDYSTAAGVDNAAAEGTFEILESETTLLGTISFDGVDVQPLPFASNTTDLDLSAFLNADTDGLVTFLFMDVAQNGDEYRMDSKEGSTADGHGPTTLSFIPGTPLGGIRMTGIQPDSASVVVSWQARGDHLYALERTTESLSNANWLELATNLLGAAVNTYTDAAPAAVMGFYRLRDDGTVPEVEYYFDDFESGAAGWTVLTGATHQAGTDWQLGTPTSGPGAAQGGGNAYATNLGGNFAPNADISLLSPTIDLTTATAPSLTFGNYYDFDGLDDFGFVYVRDDTGAEIAGLEDPVATYSGFVNVWTTAMVDLPAEVVGRTVRFEFRFVSDGSVEFAGWYIDNVRVGD